MPPPARLPAPPPARAPRGGMRRALGGAAWALSGLSALVVVGLMLLPVAGLRPLTVLSGSMAPAIAVGDMVLVAPVSPASVGPGDVVTFTDPQRSGRLITHRLERAVPRAGHFDMVTRGDANSASERWSVPAGGRIGRVTATLPRVGWALAWSRTGVGRMVGLVLPVLLIGAATLRAIWRRP
jgi:signal peptidase I